MSDVDIRDIFKKLEEHSLAIGRLASHVESEQATVNRIADELRNKLTVLEKVLLGNGKMGIDDKVRTLWHEHTEKHSNMNKLINFTYRSAIAIGIGYIAMRLGIQ